MSKKLDEVLPAEIVEALLEALKPLVPEGQEEIKMRLLERVRSEGAPRAAGFTTIRKSEGAWTQSLPGLSSKELYDDGRTRTWLARLEREARIPAHLHLGDEECLVLEGVVFLAGERMEQGDYQVARAGSAHSEVYSPTGCVLLIHSRSEKSLHA
ncbi:MAG: cupin domain-containing protein [Usitatibacter sp.]